MERLKSFAYWMLTLFIFGMGCVLVFILGAGSAIYLHDKLGASGTLLLVGIMTSLVVVFYKIYQKYKKA